MRSVIFKIIPSEILAAYRVSEEPVRRRALRRRAYALYHMINARCFGNELPKHPKIVVCGSSDDSLLASSRARYTKRRRAYARICLDPILDASSFELLPDERLRPVLIHEMVHVRVCLNGDYDRDDSHGPAWQRELIRIATLYNEPGLLEQIERCHTPTANRRFDRDHDLPSNWDSYWDTGLLDANARPILRRPSPAHSTGLFIS
jgi:hypothetical protein